ncbi:MAG: hypothetical protein AAF682_04680 [Planctomycetota bacterium]
MLELDVDRMKNGKTVGQLLTKGERKGYPWSVILDPEGEQLITSDAPDGNIGCPVMPKEAEHFLAMLDKTRQRLTDEELDALSKEHDAFAAPIIERFGLR